MSPVENLGPDQRAVLQLLLKQGRSYEELAGLLRIDPRAVRERAVGALEALGPKDGTPPPPERRAEIADYLLGQQGASQRAGTRDYLEGSASGRAWARVLAGELRPMAGERGLPDVPAEGAEVEEAFDALQARAARREEVQRSSRIGGALLLAGIGIVLAVVLVWALTSGNDKKSGDDTAAVGTTGTQTTPLATQTTTTATTSTTPTIEGQVNLTPPAGKGGKALGVVNILSQNGQRAIAVQASGLKKTTAKTAYAVWLTNKAGSSKRLGFAPPVTKTGRLQGVTSLPSDSSRYTIILITLESANAPTKPGNVVLRGSFRSGN